MCGWRTPSRFRLGPLRTMIFGFIAEKGGRWSRQNTEAAGIVQRGRGRAPNRAAYDQALLGQGVQPMMVSATSFATASSDQGRRMEIFNLYRSAPPRASGARSHSAFRPKASEPAR